MRFDGSCEACDDDPEQIVVCEGCNCCQICCNCTPTDCDCDACLMRRENDKDEDG